MKAELLCDHGRTNSGSGEGTKADGDGSWKRHRSWLAWLRHAEQREEDNKNRERATERKGRYSNFSSSRFSHSMFQNWGEESSRGSQRITATSLTQMI